MDASCFLFPSPSVHSISLSHLLAVEPDGGRGVHVLVELEPVQRRRLARRVEPEHGAVEGDGAVRQVDLLRQRGQLLLGHAPAHLEDAAAVHIRALLWPCYKCWYLATLLIFRLTLLSISAQPP